MVNKPRNNYTKEFKAEAVKLVLDEHQSATEVSRRLGVPIQTFSTWLSKARGGRMVGTTQHNKGLTDLEAENARLKKALALAEMERDILKKATAYFAKDSLRGTRS